MEQREFEPARSDEVRQYRREIRQILEALGHPEAFVNDESLISNFPLREEPETPTLLELEIALGLHVRRDERLVGVARRLRRRTEAQIRMAAPAARHEWVNWLGARDAAALLLTLLQAVDKGDTPQSIQAMVDGWRANALRALAADDYRASVDKYLEVSVDARLSLLCRPELLRTLDDLEDEADEAL
jgi:hypothetical protein